MILHVGQPEHFNEIAGVMKSEGIVSRFFPPLRYRSSHWGDPFVATGLIP